MVCYYGNIIFNDVINNVNLVQCDALNVQTYWRVNVMQPTMFYM
ncbi:hypothetical protein GPSY_3108 [Paraglaciecola psychrophila 170]|nr:hypothetical protein GPSY_3108 [Paraglaciecola psychrophila 170]